MSNSLLDLEQFHALRGLPTEARQRVARVVKPRDIAAGKTVFLRTDRLTDSVFLLSGRVSLVGADGKAREIRAGSAEAALALNSNNPAHCDCTMLDSGQLLFVPAQLMDPNVGSARCDNTYQVHDITEVNSVDDAEVTNLHWMDRLLQARLFQDIPATSLFELFQRLRPRLVHAGEEIIKQGAKADFFYVLSKGQAEVKRQGLDGKFTRLATVMPGGSFGEEALLSGALRNATVSMLTDGEVRQLSEADFHQLMVPLVAEGVSLEDTLAKINGRPALWLDVRLATEFARNGVPGSVNVPYPLLRSRLDRMDTQRPVVVVCSNGRLSATAVYLLRERGFESWRLDGGVTALRGYVLDGGNLNAA